MKTHCALCKKSIKEVGRLMKPTRASGGGSPKNKGYCSKCRKIMRGYRKEEVLS